MLVQRNGVPLGIVRAQQATDWSRPALSHRRGNEEATELLVVLVLLIVLALLGPFFGVDNRTDRLNRTVRPQRLCCLGSGVGN